MRTLHILVKIFSKSSVSQFPFKNSTYGFHKRLCPLKLYFEMSTSKSNNGEGKISESDFQVKLAELENQIYLSWSNENYQECLDLRLREMSLKKSFHNSEFYSGFPEDCCKIGVLFNELQNDEKAIFYFDLGLKNLSDDVSNYGILADLKHNKGISQMNLGNLGEAIHLVEEAKTFKKKVYDPEEDFISLGVTCFNLGNLYAEAGGMADQAIANYEEAIQLFKSGMEINQKEAMINMANAYEQLGSLHFNLKNFSKAKEIFSQTPKMFEDSFGKTHVLVVKSLCNAATTFLALRDFVQAEEFLSKALKLIDKPNEMSWTLYNLSHMLLARLEFRLGNHEKSKAHLNKAQISLNKFNADDHVQLHIFYLEKCQILLGMEEYQLAFENANKCMESNQKLFEIEKKNHFLPNILLVYAKYYFYHKKNPKKALEYIDQALNKCLECFGENEEITAQVLRMKGTVSYQQKNPEAIENLQKAEKIFETNKETSLLDLSEIQYDLGLVLLEQGDNDKGLGSLRNSLKSLKEGLKTMEKYPKMNLKPFEDKIRKIEEKIKQLVVNKN